jgi:hypothetical protein
MVGATAPLKLPQLRLLLVDAAALGAIVSSVHS